MNRRISTTRRKKTGSAVIKGRNVPALGRKRIRTPDSAQRAPLSATSSRTEKLAGRRESPAGIPAYIRAVGTAVDQEDKEYLRRKLGRKLGKFTRAIQRVSVRIDDVNGPRGGIDQRCVIKVTLIELPAVIIEASSESLQAAMDDALARVDRAVKQAVQRRRTRPLRPHRPVTQQKPRA